MDIFIVIDQKTAKQLRSFIKECRHNPIKAKKLIQTLSEGVAPVFKPKTKPKR